MSYNLSGKVAIVTGSSSGLGEVIAVHFAKWGASVTLCGRNQERLEAVRQKCVEVCGGKSDQFLAIQGDLCESKIRNKTVDETVATFGHLDIVVANAGATDSLGNFDDLTEESYERVFDTNVKSVVFLLQRAAPHLIKTKGNVVTISSISSFMATPSPLHYAMAKAAQDHMSRTLSVVLGAKGVRVNVIHPGVYRTNFTRDIEHSMDMDVVLGAIAGLTPLKRLGDPSEIAHAVGFLVSDQAKYINGAELQVDGGIHQVNPLAMSVLSIQ